MKKNKQASKEAKQEEIMQEELVNETPIDEVSILEQKLSEQNDKFTRLFAEFDNYKKRNARERLELISTANIDVLQSLIPVLDDFERAIAATNADAKEGIELIYNKFSSVLNSKGLRPLDSKVGDEFDVDIHEAITSIPAPNEELKDKIVDVVEKGYKLGDKIIRFAKVVIGE